MAEFAWAKMEPSEGLYDFEWLDEAIEILGKKGIKTVLGTPTPTPPIWIIEQNPEILPVNLQGQSMGFGGRHHNCQSNETYRNHIRRFVRVMANHYKDNPHVIGWQIDNEFGNSHQQLCACDSCRTRFHQWLMMLGARCSGVKHTADLIKFLHPCQLQTRIILLYSWIGNAFAPI
jgi:beta-galactosidase